MPQGFCAFRPIEQRVAKARCPAASELAGPPQAAFNGGELSMSDLPGGDVVTEIGYEFASDHRQ
jgi:hypothetical protein